MNPVLITAPKEEPVTLQEMKEHLRVTHNDENGLIQACARAAREEVENRLGRQLVQATWELWIDRFPGCAIGRFLEDRITGTHRSYARIKLPRPPLVSVTSIKYLDTNGVEQTVPTTDYGVDTAREPGEVYPAFGKYWPTARLEPNAIKIRYVAGYADGWAVNDLDKAFLKLIAGLLYEFREPVITGTVATRIEDLASMFWSRKIPQVA